ncbi:MAG: DUF370 domain-containing protein [Clostridiales bacterium]|nr:DUF370 domain-containing protein [Clostridiales bacterium]
MLVHLGRGVSVHGEDIIALTDLQRDQSPQTETLIGQFRRRGLLRDLGGEPKTLVICRERTRSVCYLSGVGLRTLRRRVEERQLIEMREVQHG